MGDSLVAHSDLLEQDTKEPKNREIKDEKIIAEAKMLEEEREEGATEESLEWV